MPKLQRKEAKLFAENCEAGLGGIAQFGSMAAGAKNYSLDPDVIQALSIYKQGWSAAVMGDNSPALEDRNALDFLLSYQQCYLMQMGVPEYLATQTYYKGSVCSDANGGLYMSLVDNNQGQSLTDTTYWLAFPTPQEFAALMARVSNVEDSKVSKSGDTMTGALKTPTPVADSNDTTVATTAWVRTFTNTDITGLKLNTAGKYTIASGTTLTQLSLVIFSASLGRWSGMGGSVDDTAAIQDQTFDGTTTLTHCLVAGKGNKITGSGTITVIPIVRG